MEKARDKSEKMRLRREQPSTRVATEPGVDPDIAHIIPGPQPIPEDEQ